MASGAFVRTSVLALLASVGGASAANPARADGGPPGSVPFPVGKTTTLRAPNVYVIEGAKTIPVGVEVSVEADVRIVGTANASLDVQGALKVRGTQDHWVKIEDVDFSPTRTTAGGLHLDMVDLVGCKFRHEGEEAGIAGDVTIENACLQRDCVFDVRVTGGFLKLMTVEFGMPCKIRCEPPKGGAKAEIEVEIRSSWMKQVTLSGTADVHVRHSEVKGGLECRGVAKVEVDGCDVSQSLAFRQGEQDSFRGVKLSKVNLLEKATVVLERAPGAAQKAETVELEKFFFDLGGGKESQTDKAARALVKDGADAASGNVRAVITKRQDKRHQLVAYNTLKVRIPPLR